MSTRIAFRHNASGEFFNLQVTTKEKKKRNKPNQW